MNSDVPLTASDAPVNLTIFGSPLPVRVDLAIGQNNPRSINGEVKIPAGGVGNLVTELKLSPAQTQRLQQLPQNARGKTTERRQNRMNVK